jgi:hypothetical protein
MKIQITHKDYEKRETETAAFNEVDTVERA